MRIRPSADETYFGVDSLRRFVFSAAGKAGLDQADASLLVEALVEADLRGVGTHGVYRLPAYLRAVTSGTINASPVLRRVSGRGAVQVLDGDNGLGVVVGQLAMREAVEGARNLGIGMVAVRNSNHAGMLAAHTLVAARLGFAGYFVSNAAALMPAFGGQTPVLSNGPFSYAFPTAGEPIVLDMACSAVARGKIRLAAERGETIPKGWALDRDGRPASDAQAAMHGVVLPMAGHKGYAMAVVNDILSAVLPGAQLSFDVPRAFLEPGATALDSWGIGHLAMAVDVEAFGERVDYLSKMTRLVDELRSSEAQVGQQVLLPGDPEMHARRRAMADGVRLPKETLRLLDAYAGEVGIETLASRGERGETQDA